MQQALRNIDPRLETIQNIRRQLTKAELEIMDYQPSEQAIRCHMHVAARDLKQFL